MRLVKCRAVAFGGAAMAAALCLFAPAQAQQRATQVGVDAVIEEPLSQTMPVLGRLVARQAGPVAALVSGPVQDVLVAVGDRVKQGDLLIRLSTDVTLGNRNLRAAELREKEAALETARAQARLASLELRRLESLKKSPAFSQARYEDKRAEVARYESGVAEAQAAVVRATANLELSELDLMRAEIRAPYNGVVVSRQAVPGAFVNTGASVVSLVNDEDMEIEADVPANRLAGLIPGRTISALLDGGKAIDADVRAVIPTENALTRTRPVRFAPRLSDGPAMRLATDQSVTVMIPVGEPRDVVTVHKDAVIARGSSYIVFVVEKGRAAIRQVVLGEAVGERTEVLSGLEPGDVAVVLGNERLRPGQPVTYKGAPKSGVDG